MVWAFGILESYDYIQSITAGVQESWLVSIVGPGLIGLDYYHGYGTTLLAGLRGGFQISLNETLFTHDMLG